MPGRKPQPASTQPPPRTCAACGRTITWRKKWERDWDNVKFCSDRCRSHKSNAHLQQDQKLEQAILHLLHQRGRDKTICPSEAARSIAGSGDRAAWEPLMEPARAAARRLVAAGRIDITQAGRSVDPSTAKGPVRLRLRETSPTHIVVEGG